MMGVAATRDLAAVARTALERVGSEQLLIRHEPGKPGSYSPQPEGLPESLRAALERRDMTELYDHQHAAVHAALAGRDVLITTGTASGKSLAYQLPILKTLLTSGGDTALLLYPTKALAADQATSFGAWLRDLGLPPGTIASYDGDTPRSQRPAIRRDARALLTNPDMLHAGILPHHTLWRRYLQQLRWIVVDEIHVYRGVFGGHLAGVLRRLMRLAQHYGANPTIIATSATLGNPTEHAVNVLGREVLHVAEDAAPKPARELVLTRPPLVDVELGIRRPMLAEAASLAHALAQQGLQVLMFAGSRQGVEEAVVQLRSTIDGVRSYRSGLLAQERREIEQALRDGEARIVVATNALELGIDIGGVDAVVIAGYPGAASAVRQQLGRAGRRDRPGLGVVVLGAGPLDQYLANHPERVFGTPSERALTNPDHLLLALDHLRCAAFERPIEHDEHYGTLGPEDLRTLAEHLRDEGEAHLAAGRVYWVGEQYPAERVSLRSAGRDEVSLLTTQGVAIGTIDGPSARWMVHPQAVYIHDGAPYLVTDLDLDAHMARLEPTDDRIVTRAQRDTEIVPAGPMSIRAAPSAKVALGDVTVTETVTGYRRMRRDTRETLSRHPLTLPPSTLFTRAYAFSPLEATVQDLRAKDAWSNDANDYGPDWSRQRAAVLQRDQHACRHCGTKAGQGTKLHVHHLVPFRAFASARDANRPENLVTLCPACHRLAEQSVRIRSGLAAVAYVLRSLAPLHVLADARDLGVHADPASRLVEGGPAVVIYETVPGGVGLADALADAHTSLLKAAHAVVQACACTDGCPGCVGPAGEAGHAGKREALFLLEALT